MAWRNGIRIFAGSTGKEFAQRMCDHIEVELGKSEAIYFSEGNVFVRVLETVRDKDVFLVQPIGLKPNDEFTEILFWMDALKRASANSVTAIIPFYGYAKGDHKDEPRVSIRARVCAECIELAGADRVVVMDLHSPQVQGFFKIPVDHLLGAPILIEYIKTIMEDDYVVVATDAGFAKDARRFAGNLGMTTAICDKRRLKHDENAEIMEVIGDVENKDCLIVDDFTNSAGTLISTAKQLKSKGANKIYACVSHALLNEAAMRRVENSDISLLITTDSVHNTVVIASPKTRIISVAPLFAETLRRIYMNESVSVLFDRIPINILEKLDKLLVEK